MWRVVLMFKCIVTWEYAQHIVSLFTESANTPEALRSFTRRTELMTSLPISSNTSTFHIAPPGAMVSGALCESSCASTSVTGALRFKIRFMLAAQEPSAVAVDSGRAWSTYLLVPQCDGHGDCGGWLAPAEVQVSSYARASMAAR